MEEKILLDGVSSLREAGTKAPVITGIKTGIEGLDELFFTTKIEKNKVKKIPLGGIPSYSVVNITGVADTGKSLMAEQIAVTQASLGHNVCFITVESPSAFVALSLKERARAMGIDEKIIEERIYFIDAASYSQYRDDLQTLFNTLAYVIKENHIKLTVIDSITGFFEEKEMLARSVVRRFFNFLKKWYQTGVIISQKRSGHEELTAESAGGYAVSHIVDCSMVLAKVQITTKYEEKMYGKPIGEMVRLFRIDGCRLCGHDTTTRLMEITETGLVKIGPSLVQLQQGGKK